MISLLRNTFLRYWIYYSFLLLQTVLLLPEKEHHIARGTRECDSALGMQNRNISDAAITASTYYVEIVGPKYGRLNMEEGGGGWCPRQPIDKGSHEYLQVDLGSTHIITGMQTQGRYGHGHGQEYAREYKIEYKRPDSKKWIQYQRWDGSDVLTGNVDTSSVLTHRLMPPIFASIFRIQPYSNYMVTICLRLELRGCLYESGIARYYLPRDPFWSTMEDIGDVSYDGEKQDGYLVNGLGRLVDGIYGGDSFNLDVGLGSGSGWVGWKSDTFAKPYIELTFEFDTIRKFNTVSIFSNNNFKKGVQVFSKARILFSNGGQFYNSEPIVYTYTQDLTFETARNVIIMLYENIAKYIKIQLYFSSVWVMISEVSFESEIAVGNFTDEVELIPAKDVVHISGGMVIDPPWEPAQNVPQAKTTSYMEIIIGILSLLLALVAGVFISVLIISWRNKWIMRRNGIQTGSYVAAFVKYQSENVDNKEMQKTPPPASPCAPPHTIDNSENNVIPVINDSSPSLSYKTENAANEERDTEAEVRKPAAVHKNENECCDKVTSSLSIRKAAVVVTSADKVIVTGMNDMDHPEEYVYTSKRKNKGSVSGKNKGTIKSGVNKSGSKTAHRVRKPQPTAVHHAPKEITRHNEYCVSVNGVPVVLPPTIICHSPKEMTEHCEYSVPNDCDLPIPLPTTIHHQPKESAKICEYPSTNGDLPAQSPTSDCNLEIAQQCEYSVPMNENLPFQLPTAACHLQKEKTQHRKCSKPTDSNLQANGRFNMFSSDKTRLMNPCMSWNIAQIIGLPYKCKESDIVPIPRYALKIYKKLGSSYLGEAFLCETEGINVTENGVVLSRSCKADGMREIRYLMGLQDGNIARIVGVCTGEQPPWLILEYPGDLGDLPYVLQNTNKLMYSTLLFMGTQVASAMKYLESRNLVHKDLAARNCLVSKDFIVKVTDIAICNDQYQKDYVNIGSRPSIPVRWLPWESILLERYESSVWSFGVTLWEIFSKAEEIPYSHLTDMQVIHNAEELYYGERMQEIDVLPKPEVCPTDIYDLMCECWEREQNDRPSFKQIYAFLKRHNKMSTSDLDLFYEEHNKTTRV